MAKKKETTKEAVDLPEGITIEPSKEYTGHFVLNVNGEETIHPSEQAAQDYLSTL